MFVGLLHRVITTEAGRKLAEQWKAVFVEASAKQNEVCQCRRSGFEVCQCQRCGFEVCQC